MPEILDQLSPKRASDSRRADGFSPRRQRRTFIFNWLYARHKRRHHDPSP